MSRARQGLLLSRASVRLRTQSPAITFLTRVPGKSQPSSPVVQAKQLVALYTFGSSTVWCGHAPLQITFPGTQTDMATVTVHIKASPAAVFRVLADGWTYSQWVVGTSHIRAVDSEWPTAGSKLYHCVGAWPASIRDHTIVENSDPDKRLLLTARGWPVGEAKVELVLTAEGNGTRVEIRETATGGAGRLLRNPVGEKLVYRRNVESMARLAALVERRTRPVEEAEGSEEK